MRKSIDENLCLIVSIILKLCFNLPITENNIIEEDDWRSRPSKR